MICGLGYLARISDAPALIENHYRHWSGTRTASRVQARLRDVQAKELEDDRMLVGGEA